MYMHMHMHMYVCMYVCICMYVCMYIHTYILKKTETLRGLPMNRVDQQASNESMASVAASDISASHNDASVRVALGFTFKMSKSDRRWRVSTISLKSI